jgi:VWFA-related protein
MIRHLARAFLFLFCVLHFYAVSQDLPPLRVGVSVLTSGSTDVSDHDLRNELVKTINKRNIEKKLKMPIEAVPLDAPAGGQAIVEAKAKGCAYVLYLYLRPIEGSNEYQQSYSGTVIENRPMTTATVEYLVRRVSDQVAYAGGTGKSQPLISPREAILQAAQKTGDQVVADLAKGGNAGSTKLAEAAGLEEMTSATAHDTTAGKDFCAWLPSDLAHIDALRGACEYAMTLPQKMPNFICRQETSRFDGRNKIPTDFITANVRYENGDESYSDFMRNGKPTPEAAARTIGLWSSGQLEASLRAIFHSVNQAIFEFSGENQAGDRVAWVFTYRIARQEQSLWQLRANGMVAAPPYNGELWVDQRNGNVLRFTSKANDLPKTFPMQKAEILIDYGDVEFGDGSAFVMPLTSSIATQFRGYEPTRNLVQFRGCHKFRAKAHMLLSLSGDDNEKSPGPANAAQAVDRDREQSETIYAILREQAIRDDAALLNAEQQQDLKWATVGVFAKLAALEKERQQRVGRDAAAISSVPAPSATDPVATFRASVKLVPVSVVVRDGNGHAVGNLTRTDFELFDERRPQPIHSFSIEKTPLQPAADSARPTPDESDPGKQKEATPANHVAYVFDDLHSTFEDIENARDAATRHVDEMRPEDQAAVFTTSGTVSLNFTADRDKLKSALHALRSHTRSTAGDCPEISYYMADLALNQDDRDASETLIAQAMECTFHGTAKGNPAELEKARQVAMAKAFEVVSSGRAESQNALATLHEVVTATAAMTGRRSIVLVSPGFLVADPGAQDNAMAIIDQAVEAGVVVNTLDVRGVLTTSVSAKASDLANTGHFERQEATARDVLMTDFAYGTGGVFFHNNNDLVLGFRQTADVPEYIYVLGFSPQKLDGKFHKLRVKLNNGEKLTVQARAGYYALKQPSAR